MKIIDFHFHLGDILHEGGGELIWADKPFRYGFDPDLFFRSMNYHFQSFGDKVYKIPLLMHATARAERKRNQASTLANYLARMESNHVSCSVCQPIAPFVTFADLARVHAHTPSILPFGSIDFEAGAIEAQAAAQLSGGAYGFKVHPVIQRVHPQGAELKRLAQALPEGTIVMFHSGICCYYPASEREKERPEYGAVSPIINFAAQNPHLRVVAAHGGLQEHKLLAEGLKRVKNLYVDTSFTQCKRLRLFIESTDPERILFASDWPYGFIETSLACLKEAFGRDEGLMRRILYENAAEILKMDAVG
jgi:hypothetical protein